MRCTRCGLHLTLIALIVSVLYIKAQRIRGVSIDEVINFLKEKSVVVVLWNPENQNNPISGVIPQNNHGTGSRPQNNYGNGFQSQNNYGNGFQPQNNPNRGYGREQPCTTIQGEEGHCRSIRSCAKVVRNYRQVVPTLCYWRRRVPIVCCPPEPVDKLVPPTEEPFTTKSPWELNDNSKFPVITTKKPKGRPLVFPEDGDNTRPYNHRPSENENPYDNYNPRPFRPRPTANDDSLDNYNPRPFSPRPTQNDDSWDNYNPRPFSPRPPQNENREEEYNPRPFSPRPPQNENREEEYNPRPFSPRPPQSENREEEYNPRPFSPRPTPNSDGFYNPRPNDQNTGNPTSFNSGCGVRPTPGRRPGSSPNTEVLEGDGGGGVVGGRNATPYSWPWMTGIFVGNGNRPRFRCGGSLISLEYVITAAHCFPELLSSSGRRPNMFVRIGGHLVDDGIRYDVQSVTIHEDYRATENYYDIAVLHLSEIIRDDRLTPVCLPPPPPSGREIEFEPISGTNVTVLGWGDLQFGGTSSNILQELTIPIVSHEECKDSYSRISPAYISRGIVREMVCAGVSEGGRDSCQNDSGGPLLMESNNRWSLVGIVSFGYNCALPGYPGVYTKVSSYLPWITRHTDVGRS